MNKNTTQEWDNIWQIEGPNTWRTYPCTFNKICELLPMGSNVLELGCGTGILSYQMQTKGCNVTGIDISKIAIAWMDIIYKMKGIVHEFPPLPKLENVDVIVASQTLEHFEDPNILLKEMSQMANMAIIAVPNNTLGEDECEYHHQKFTRETITELLFNYYNHIEVYELTDIFMENRNKKIEIPVLICKCWGSRRE